MIYFNLICVGISFFIAGVVFAKAPRYSPGNICAALFAAIIMIHALGAGK